MTRSTKRDDSSPPPSSTATSSASSSKLPSKETEAPGAAAAGKKRKRPSLLDAEDTTDEPALKRSASASLKGEDDTAEQDTPNPEGTAAGTTALLPDAISAKETPALPAKETGHSSVGDLPLSDGDAKKVLDVLEAADTQGLLDRVFLLPQDGESDKTAPVASGVAEQGQTPSISFRALLQDATKYRLRVLRAAVQNLLPISSHPRGRPSQAAAQQARFCALALSLLDQASASNAPTLSALPTTGPDSETKPNTDIKQSAARADSHAPQRATRFALLQRLPTGDFWSSLSSPSAPASPLHPPQPSALYARAYCLLVGHCLFLDRFP